MKEWCQMRKTVLAGIAVIAMAGSCMPTRAWAITPEDVFQTGRRAFLLGHWSEAADGFSRFLDRWPGHPLCAEGTLYRLISESRAGFDRVRREYEESRLASLTAGLAFVRQKLPDADLVELDVELRCLQYRLDPSADWSKAVLELPPEQLAHILKRNVLPAPADDPRGTLLWINGWKARHWKSASGEIRAAVELRKARALWQIILSPLPASRMEGDMRASGDFPPYRALIRSLREAFKTGEPDVKREAALLGVCCSSLVPVSRRDWGACEEWKTYLDDRGTDPEGAWCPR